MSFGSDPPPQNPYAMPQDRGGFPQHLGQMPPENSSTKTQLTVVGCILLSMGIITLGLALIGMISNAVDGKLVDQPPEGMPPGQQVGFTIGNLAGQAGLVVFQLIASCGGLCMITRKVYPLAIAGAAVSLIPLCGPCLGLSIPFGIWALILLLRPEIKFAF